MARGYTFLEGSTASPFVPETYDAARGAVVAAIYLGLGRAGASRMSAPVFEQHDDGTCSITYTVVA